MLNKSLVNKVLKILSPHRPNRVGIFGSFARGENIKQSDLDILISFKESVSLLKLVMIQQELSDKLHLDVDLVTEGSLKNKKLKKSIYTDLIMLKNEE